MAYLSTIPAATDAKNVSQGQIQENFSQIYTVFSVDHATFDSPLGAGYHQQATFPSIAVMNPGATYMRLYGNTGTSGNPELWLWNGTTATNTQCTTAHKVGGANTNGYTMTPAGLLIKWGNITQAGTATGQPQVFTWSATGTDIPFTTQFWALAQIGADPALPNKDVNAIAYVTDVTNPAQISYNVWRRNLGNTAGTNQNPFSAWFLAVGVP